MASLSLPRTTGDHKQQENAGPCEYSASGEPFVLPRIQ